MSGFPPNQPNPYKDPYGQPKNPNPNYNPYGAPQHGPQGPGSGGKDNGIVMAPAILFILVGGLGLLLDLFGVYSALFMPPPPVDPGAPEFINQMIENSRGPVAASLQGFFALLSLVVIFGGIQLMRLKSWTFSIVTAIIAMINIGNFCCVLGLIPGIWTLIVVNLAQVKPMFEDQGARTHQHHNRPY